MFDFSVMHDHIVDVFGDDATFTPVSGTPVSCRVVLRRPDVQVEFGGYGSGVVEAQKIRVRQTEIFTPATGDKFTVGLKEYTIVGCPMQDIYAGVWDCVVAET